jgi:hypothetical protein
MKKDVPALPSDRRRIKTPKGVEPIRGVSDFGLQVERGGDLADVRWADVAPADLAALATAAFAGSEEDRGEIVAAYAFAHRLEDLFWQAVLSLDEVVRERSGLESRAEARFSK